MVRNKICLKTLFFNTALGYAIWEVLQNQVELQLHETIQLLSYANVSNLLGILPGHYNEKEMTLHLILTWRLM
jgi:hypothetical protein